ncbi:sensor histidine kinase [Cohnella hashimotonis]|uniref:Sensor histidine kinase n=1 Tax=Cohnella hashimotonis TaxID=2826895 RepID=A0ABT6TSC8_9BACL|nr:sensor histidine kinase [Cohnella hashimotonis]
MSFGRMRLRTKLFLILVPTLLVFSTITLRGTESYLQRQMKNTIDDQIAINYEKIGNSIELLVQGVNMLSIRLLTDQKIYNLLNGPEGDQADKQSKLNELLANTMIDGRVVGKLFIRTDGADYYGYPAAVAIEAPDQAFVDRILASSTPVWGDIRKDEEGKAYLQLGRKFQNFYTGQQLGVLIVEIKEEALYELIQNTIHPWGYSMLVDGDRIISAGDKSKLGAVMFDWVLGQRSGEGMDRGHPTIKVALPEGETYAVSSYPLTGNLERIGLKWSIVNLASEDKLYASIRRMERLSAWIQGLVFVVALGFALYLAATTLKPVNGLIGKIKGFGKTAPEAPEQKHAEGASGDELQVLSRSFDDMVVRIDELIANNNESKDKQRESELVALQAQINPHFLYNTLDAIGWIAKINAQPDIERLVLELASFYRLSLHKGDKFIRVEEELGIVKSYVAIEEFRYPDKFEVHYDIQAEILPFPMLKIILQPLIENAIVHGIGPKASKGTITVKGAMERHALRFDITDDGIGFDSDQVLYAAPKTYSGRGYGIANVDERIRMEYGDQYGITIRSVPGSGTTATVVIGLGRGDS